MASLADPTVLVIDDEPNLRDMLEIGLAHHGFAVVSAGDGPRGARAAARAVARRDPARRDDAEDRRRVARAADPPPHRGADPDALGAERRAAQDRGSCRRRRRLRRRNRSISAKSPRGCARSSGGRSLRSATRSATPTSSSTCPTRRVQTASGHVELTAREFDLLVTLLREPGRVFTRDQLLDRVWGRDAAVEPNVVETYVSYLRGKLGELGPRPLIRTIRRVGYTARVD